MHRKLGEILVQAGAIDDEQLLAALGDQKNWGHRLGVTLVKMGFVTEEELVNGLANQLNLPIAHLEGKRILPEVLQLVPEEFADKHMCLPLFVKRSGSVNHLFVGMDDPCNLQALDDLSFRTGMEVKPVLVASSELCQGIDFFYRGTQEHPREASEEEAPEIASRDFVIAPAADETESMTESMTVTEPEPEPPSAEDVVVEAVESVDEPPEIMLSQFDSVSERIEAASKSESNERVGEQAIQSAPAEGAVDLKARRMLRVLSQILIEKQLVDQEELWRRVRVMADDCVEFEEFD
jgi:hypothetical protein